ncbi:MAG: hypothetical protein RJA70_4090 [Pseudomonadota bacterium]
MHTEFVSLERLHCLHDVGRQVHRHIEVRAGYPARFADGLYFAAHPSRVTELVDEVEQEGIVIFPVPGSLRAGGRRVASAQPVADSY